MTIKLSSQEVSTLLLEASQALRQAQQQQEKLATALKEYERKERARKIAAQLLDNGTWNLIEEKTASILQSGEDLDILEKAVELRADAPKLASVGEEDYFPTSSVPEEVPKGKAAEGMVAWLLS